MPLPKIDTDIISLSERIEQLSEVLDENLSEQAEVLGKAKSQLKFILESDFEITEYKNNDLFNIIDKLYFQKEFNKTPSITEKIINDTYNLFRKIKSIKNKLDKVILSDVEVNKKIQRKFCKVVSDYGDGTGYIVNDEKGDIVSSFHLVGAIKSLKIPEKYKVFNVLSILHAAGYLDNEFRLTKSAMAIQSKEELIKKISELKSVQRITKNIKISPNNIKAILADEKNKMAMLKALEEASKRGDGRYSLNQNNKNEFKIAVALLFAGYLNENFCLKDAYKSIEFSNIDIIPNSEEYLLEFNPMGPADEEKTKQVFLNNADKITDDLFDFFQKGKTEKEVVLLSEQVEIHCGNNRLIGKVKFPADMKEQDKAKILKNYAYFDAVPIQITHFEKGIAFSDGTKAILTGSIIKPLPEFETPAIGEKIYYGGYPLTQQEYTFSTGIISAISYSEARKCFVIEAHIAPGNSGSPVFIQRNGEIYWIGVINSEVAHVTEKMLGFRKKLATQKELVKIGDLGFIDLLNELTTTLLDNLSTGKGKAFNITSIENLHDVNLVDHNGVSIDPFLDFLVPKKLKGPNKIREEIKKAIDEKQNNSVFKVIETAGKTYYIGSDNHGLKHTKLSSSISKKWAKSRRDVERNWGHKTPATFNLNFCNKYEEILEQVVTLIAENGEKSNFVQYPEPVGWDMGRSKDGEETDIIELYYEDELGAHMRPKAASWLSKSVLEGIIRVKPAANYSSSSALDLNSNVSKSAGGNVIQSGSASSSQHGMFAGNTTLNESTTTTDSRPGVNVNADVS